MARPTWDEYFLDLTRTVASRSTCDRGRSGCVIVKQKHILCTGYVGSPPGMPHCDEAGHLLRKVIDEDGQVRQHCMRTIHAEQNAINQAAKFGISLDGATLYCKMEPCRTCAMSIVASGIKKVVCEKHYHAAEDTKEIFSKCGVDLEVVKDEVETYENM
ncbi:MAG: cytidine/deoxycytidylate deaminase family protein [Nitrososphaerota archaeon]|nr:cytidine/deoxycytidylate deaminase family protein [Nitrososphaerota archaeon]